MPSPLIAVVNDKVVFVGLLTELLTDEGYGRFLEQKRDQLRTHHADVLEKPFSVEELLTKIKVMLGPGVQNPAAAAYAAAAVL